MEQACLKVVLVWLMELTKVCLMSGGLDVGRRGRRLVVYRQWKEKRECGGIEEFKVLVLDREALA